MIISSLFVLQCFELLSPLSDRFRPTEMMTFFNFERYALQTVRRVETLCIL